MTDADLATHSNRIIHAMRAAYGVSGRTLARSVKRAGRLLPGHVRRACQVILDAEDLTAHPKLRRCIDPAEIKAAEKVVLDHLAKVDAKDRRKGKILGVAGVIVFNLLVIATAFIVWLVWSGHL